jgi:hypothetical protein
MEGFLHRLTQATIKKHCTELADGEKKEMVWREGNREREKGREGRGREGERRREREKKRGGEEGGGGEEEGYGASLHRETLHRAQQRQREEGVVW